MAKSFQHEIPKARVNITLDLYTGGAKKKIELPLSLLVLGNYSGRKSEVPIGEREKIKINKENFNAVLKGLQPKLKINVDNKITNDNTDLPIDLAFDGVKSFSPDTIAQRVPELKKLLAIRNLLRELKSNLSDNAKLRQELEMIVLADEHRAILQQELKALSCSDQAANNQQN